MVSSRSQKIFSQTSWALFLVLLIGLSLVQRVAAHAYLIRSDPVANTILDTAPSTMSLWFSEAISPDFSGARLLDTSGNATPLTAQVEATDPTLMVVTLPELEAGVYTLRWSAHSATDGHLTQGLLVFGIGEEADLGMATAVATDTAVVWPELVLRWLTFALYAGLLGAFAITYFVLNPQTQPPAIADVQQNAQKRMLGLAWYCALCALIVGVAWVFWQAISLANSFAANFSVAAAGWQWLSQTQLGFYWWARQLVTLLVIGNLWILRRHQSDERRLIWVIRVTGLLLLALLLIQSLTSHAAALTPHTPLAIIVDAFHLLAASFWVGGLMALVIGLLPLVRHRADFAVLVQSGWRPFGTWAVLSVGVLVITGIYSTGREVSSVDSMFSTLYGRTLLFKIGLMLIMGFIGATNATVLHPRLSARVARLLRKPGGWTPLSLRRLPGLFITEVALGLLILLLAGLLTAVPTARGVTYSANTSSNLSQTVGDMFIKLNVDPNRVGPNIFTVRAVSTRRPPPAEIARVILRFTYLDQDLGLTSVDMAEVEPDFYLLSGNQLYVAGSWQIDVVVRRQGLEDSVAQFKWFVAPPATSQETPVFSDQPWESLLTTIAAVLLLVLLGTAVLWRMNRQ